MPPEIMSGAILEPDHLRHALDVREKLESRLDHLLDASSAIPENLSAAMEHALFAPGKRLRPLLVYLIAEPDLAQENAALDLGCAVEMVHTASLVLDDLPCMDDARMRRDRPTTHIAFGQATAILSAIALLSRAFGIIAELDIPAAKRTRLATILSTAVGHKGLAAGQEIDLNGRSTLSGTAEVENLNWLKTGMLFEASAEMGAVLRGLRPERMREVRIFARHLGLAFQTADDLLDVFGDAEGAGKDVNKDAGKPTIVTLHGAGHAHMTCRQHVVAAERALRASGVSPAPIEALIAKYLKLETRFDGQ